MKGKLNYLDGLRGLAAFIVVVHHYTNAFYPVYSVNNIGKSPLSLLYDGNTSVCVFFVLSGFVLSSKFFRTGNPDVLIASATKRYFRLLLPVLSSVLLAYVFMRLNLFSFKQEVAGITGSRWLSSFYTFDPNFIEMLKQGLYRVFLYGESSYNTNLWTIYLEFFGSMLTFAFLALFGKVKKRYLIYIVMFYILYRGYYLAFLLGIMLSDMYHSETGRKLLIKNKAALLGIFIISLYFASYPYALPVTGTIYEILIIPFLKNVYFYQLYHILGGFLLVYVLLSSNILQKIFSGKVFIFLGNISFSLYVFHLIILCSFSTALFKFLLVYFTYKVSFLLMFGCSLVILFPLSYLAYKYIDLTSIKFGNIAYSYLKGDRKTNFNKDTSVKRTA